MATQQKRPRLSLKIQTSVGPVARVSRPPTIDTKDPTAFNTLSNAYASVVGRSAAVAAHSEPLTAINTLQAFSLATPVEKPDPSNRVNTPYTMHYPDTPLSAHPTSPRHMEINYPSTMTATPPLSGTTDSNESRVFTFASTDIAHGKLAHRLYDNAESLSTRPRTIVYQPSAPGLLPPYTPSQARHSILRNSPLPAKTAIVPPSPRRQSLRLQQKASRRVGYNSPLEQEITTNTYTRMHLDLLAEEASPLSPYSPSTPGGLNEMADSTGVSPSSDMSDAPKRPIVSKPTAAASSPVGIRKRKSKKEKTRRWVWTIGQDEDEEESGSPATSLRVGEAVLPKIKTNELGDMTPIGPPIPQIAYPQAPIPSIELPSDASNDRDVEMTDGSSVISVDTESLHSVEQDLDIAMTPIAPRGQPRILTQAKPDTPIPELATSRDGSMHA